MSRDASDRSVYVAHGNGRAKLLAFGIPTLGRVSMRWVEAHYQLGMLTNIPARRIYVQGKDIAEARNEIVARAFDFDDDEHEVTHLFFLDDDVMPHPEALKKLYANGRDICSGLYYLKYATETPMILMPETTGVARAWRPGEIVDCAVHGMGLTLISMDVFRRLRDETELGVDVFGFPKWFATLRDHMTVADDGRRVIVNETEDTYFLRRAAALGYQPCVDTSAQAFGWHWVHGEQRAYPLRQWAEFQRDGTITWTETPDGVPVTWGRVA